MKLLEGEKSLVTGAGRGIGRAIALALAGAGADVALFDLERSLLEETSSLVEKEGVAGPVLSGDVSDFGTVRDEIGRLLADWGRLDILVNNAGITRDALLLRMDEEDWDRVLAVNLKGAFNTCRAAARTMMKQKSGAVVNVASIVGLVGNAGQANYAASKGGLIAFTKSLAKELAPRGVRANAVAPGFISTGMTEAIPEEIRGKMLEQIPLSRIGSPEDVARAVLFLASPASGYVTGQVMVVDGGMCM